MSAKSRKTFTLDQEPLDELATEGESLSSTVNRLLWDEVARRRRTVALAEYLDELDAELGPPDQALVEHFEKLLA